MTRAIIGIGCGAVLSGIAIAGIYFLDLRHNYTSIWSILSLASWVVLAWGEGEFSKYRGYSGAVGYSLTALALFMELFIVFRCHNPWIFALGFIFVAAMPIGIIMAMPRKNGSSHKNRKRGK